MDSSLHKYGKTTYLTFTKVRQWYATISVDPAFVTPRHAFMVIVGLPSVPPGIPAVVHIPISVH